MTDARYEDVENGDRLPWLEAVDEDDDFEGPGAGKTIAYVLIGLIAIAAIVGGIFWLGIKGDRAGLPELIKAQPGPYKVKPDDPGGMEVEGKGDSAFATSMGANPRGRIDADAVPETPVAKAPPAPKAAAPTPAPRTPAPAPAPTASSGGGGSIQLGAFSSQAAAEGAWKAMAGRFTYLAPLGHSVTPVKSGDRTLYRLRAGGAGASDVCARLRVAGEQCVSVQ